MDQKAYQSQLKDGAFTPVRRAKFDKQRDAINARQERGEQNYLRQLEANSRQEVQNAGMMAKDVEALSAFSKTLTESLVERQKEKNNEEAHDLSKRQTDAAQRAPKKKGPTWTWKGARTWSTSTPQSRQR